MTTKPWPVLLAIDFKTKMCDRWAGRNHTHAFQVESDITQEKVDTMRQQPDGAGQPQEVA